MSFKPKHFFHLVEPSPWPLFTSISLFCLAIQTILYFNFFSYTQCSLIPTIFLLSFTVYNWLSDIITEGTFQGFHTLQVQLGLKLGFLLFIVSEICFFFGFFWAFFHSAISPTIELGAIWPPIGINILNPFEIPLLNTFFLLFSGFTLTISHYYLLKGIQKKVLIYLSYTLILAFFFTLFQIFEYFQANFNISDGIFGSTFYLATGFHGIHVFIGTIFLFIAFLRVYNFHFTKEHHLGFEMAAWYWHFVDVVWLFLYIFIYWWTSFGA